MLCCYILTPIFLELLAEDQLANIMSTFVHVVAQKREDEREVAIDVVLAGLLYVLRQLTAEPISRQESDSFLGILLILPQGSKVLQSIVASIHIAGREDL